jgi:hypothetical protein
VHCVAKAKITDNIIETSLTGVYVRDSVAEIGGNTIHDAGSHGITFIGAVGGSSATGNVIEGIGPSAVDTGRADGNPLPAPRDVVRGRAQAPVMAK